MNITPPLAWRRDIPKSPGLYLRVNAGHGITLHHIHKRGRYLSIYWGGFDARLMESHQKQWKYKLGGWQWYGPIKEPDYYLGDTKTVIEINDKKKRR